jgi:hypothetical protein
MIGISRDVAGGFVKRMETVEVLQAVLPSEWNQQRFCRWICQMNGISRGYPGNFVK